jgi:hypothetical protein
MSKKKAVPVSVNPYLILLSVAIVGYIVYESSTLSGSDNTNDLLEPYDPTPQQNYINRRPRFKLLYV